MIGLIAQDVVAVPEVAWSLLSPLLVLAVGGILLITITSVAPPLRGRGFPAAFTILTAAVAGWFLRANLDRFRWSAAHRR